MLGFLPGRRLFPEAIWGPAGLKDMTPSVLIWEELQPAQYPHHFNILCWLDTTSWTSSHQMLLSQFIPSIKTSAAFNTLTATHCDQAKKCELNLHEQPSWHTLPNWNISRFILKHDKSTLLPHDASLSQMHKLWDVAICFWCVEWMSCKYAQEYRFSIQWVPNKMPVWF